VTSGLIAPARADTAVVVAKSGAKHANPDEIAEAWRTSTISVPGATRFRFAAGFDALCTPGNVTVGRSGSGGDEEARTMDRLEEARTMDRLEQARAIAAIAGEQDNLITRGQLLGLGVGRRAIARRVENGRPGRRPGMCLHRARGLAPSEVVTRAGLALTSPARTICDIAGSEPVAARSRRRSLTRAFGGLPPTGSSSR
jgi:hypothetical protein